MNSFKQFIAEEQSKHSDIFLVLMKNLKLDLLNSCKIWEMCGKREEFRHVTNKYGALYLVKNKDKKVTISGSKFTKLWSGVETRGGAVLKVMGDYTIWWPRDAWTYIGQDGSRWMDIEEAIKPCTKRGQQGNCVLPVAFSYDYTNELKNLIAKTPVMNNLINVNEDVDAFSFEDVKNVTKNFPELTKPIMDKFVKDALKIQTKLLDKYSDKIQEKLMAIYQMQLTTRTGGGGYADEAVINNVEVVEVIETSASGYSGLEGAISSIGRMIDNQDRGTTEYNAKELKDKADSALDSTMLGELMFDTKYNKLYTIYEPHEDQFYFMDMLKKRSFGPAMVKGWNYIMNHYPLKWNKKFIKIR